MNEALLTGALVRTFRTLPGAVVFKHADLSTAGIPDISVSWKGKISWWETKYLHPTLHDRAAQHFVMQQLQRACENKVHYVLYIEARSPYPRRTLIILPSVLKDITCWRDWGLQSEGFNHQFVLDFLRRLHNVPPRSE
jgi:hypothetical protein